MVTSAEIGVQAAGQHLGQHARRRSATLHPSHETRMHVAARIRQDMRHEFAVHLIQWRRRAWHRSPEVIAYSLGHGLPDRARANMSDVVEHVIEHAVGLGPEIRPLLGVERCIRRRGRRLAHAAFACRPARRYSMAWKAWKIFCICAGL